MSGGCFSGPLVRLHIRCKSQYWAMFVRRISLDLCEMTIYFHSFFSNANWWLLLYGTERIS